MSFFIAYHPVYVHAVPEGHRFPMAKYHLLYHQIQLEGILEQDSLLQPDRIDPAIVSRVHDPAYIEKLISLNCTPREQRVSGFVHNSELIDRELVIMEGTRLCAEMAWETRGVGLNIAGGTHHAYTNRGEGFCLLNDQAIAAQWLLDTGRAQRVLIIDLDVHQGNGTAEIFQNNDAVFTFSMHGEANYPLKKEFSNRDVHLPTGICDSAYLSTLEQELNSCCKEFNPDFVFYQCGVDVLESDQLGKLSLSIQGTKERDRMVFQFAKDQSVPIVCSMGGGYSKELRYIVEAHMNTFRLAHFLF
jgi:acetoin utilization deacetylase AcuC-like enzyme